MPNGTHWQRIDGQLIELSLTNTDARKHEGRWEIRVEGNVLTLQLLDDEGYSHEKLVIERRSVEVENICYSVGSAPGVSLDLTGL